MVVIHLPEKREAKTLGGEKAAKTLEKKRTLTLKRMIWFQQWSEKVDHTVHERA